MFTGEESIECNTCLRMKGKCSYVEKPFLKKNHINASSVEDVLPDQEI